MIAKTGPRHVVTAAALWVVALCCCATTVGAQTISGTLIDAESEAPIPLGLVMMFTESGDSIGATVASPTGHFLISASGGGSFLLLAVALGYRETAAGVFDLGDGGEMTVQYRLGPEPLPLDEIIVSLERPATMHHLVRNGFVRRLQRGLGVFITPWQIEQSSARSTEQLLEGIPNLRIGPVYESLQPDAPPGTMVRMVPRLDIGETIQIRSPSGGWCRPTVYVDGVRSHFDPSAGFTLSNVVDRTVVEGIEVYRRPAEIPVEYSQALDSNCGVLVVWTKLGLAPGQSGGGRRAGSGDGVVGSADGPGGAGRLPTVDDAGPPPTEGEAVRMALTPEVAGPLSLPPTWGGSFAGLDEGHLIATDPLGGRAVAIPLDGVVELQVERQRSSWHAYQRGALAALALGVGTWLGLRALCSWSQCNGAVERPWIPAATVGLFVGVLVQRRGPGMHWVEAPLPAR